jgi:ATP-dependent RNA helicase MSS116
MQNPKVQVHVGPKGGKYIIKNGTTKQYLASSRSPENKNGSEATTTTSTTTQKSQIVSFPKKKKTIVQSGGEISTLTEVQARTLVPGIAGKDVLAKSNTGSGKTLAFLMVAIERIRSHGGPDPNTSFPIVILTPVTDLAMQIMQVAKRFLAYHHMVADVVIGGTNERQDIQRLSTKRIDVLVATPGRFKSILDQSSVIANRLSRCQTFVIDEADKMTDPGFLGQTKFIHAKAQNPKMQTLMFSATMNKDTLISTGLLKPNAEFIDASAGSKPQVNTKVRQVSIVTPIETHLDALVQVVREMSAQRGGNANPQTKVYRVDEYTLTLETKKALKEWEMPSMKGFRIMVFLSSNAFIDFFAKVFNGIMPNIKAFVLHGNLQQNKRSKMSEAFRTTENCILFTSDASARGVDYPDVTCVIQLGFDSRSEYFQRIGRTGRAGKSGTAYLITCPEENNGIETICEVLTEMYVGNCEPPRCANEKTRKFVYSGLTYPKGVPHQDAKKALSGWLGSLASKWKVLKMPPSHVVSMVQSQTKALGLNPIPMEKLCEKLHLPKPCPPPPPKPRPTTNQAAFAQTSKKSRM